MRRREFITLLGGVTAGRSLIVRARQVDRVRLIGVLMGYAESDREGQDNFAAFREGLQKLGWTEGSCLSFPGYVCGLHPEGRRFEPVTAHQSNQMVYGSGNAHLPRVERSDPPPATMSYHHIICDDCSSPRLSLPRWAASRKEGASCIGL